MYRKKTKVSTIAGYIKIKATFIYSKNSRTKNVTVNHTVYSKFENIKDVVNTTGTEKLKICIHTYCVFTTTLSESLDYVMSALVSA